MRIVLAADGAGAPLLNVVREHLTARSDVKFTDLTKDGDPKEYYATIAERAGLAILSGQFDRGILCCGTGIGVAMSANKVPGIRAAQTHDTYSAERAARSNNAHIITMGARVVGPELAKAIVDAWLASEFDPQGTSASNVRAVEALDAKYMTAVDQVASSSDVRK